MMMMKMMLSAVLMYTHVLLPLRWKQHEAYVQVLEAKYADLCCKCTHYNVGTQLHLIIIEIYLLMPLFFFISFFLSFFAASANDVTGLKESEEKLKQQQQESARRENILVMRLATKEQEMQECTVCVYSSTSLKRLM